MARSLFMPVFSLLIALSACDRSDRGAADGDSRPTRASRISAASGGALTPSDTVCRVHELRTSGKLEWLGEHLVPEQREHNLDLIHATDRLLSANRVLQAAITEHLGPATAAAFDRSRTANAIGVFSTEVEVLSQRVEGNRATVTIQVADRVPLENVHLVRDVNRWLIRTDPPIPEVSAQMGKLADVLIRTARRLADERMTAAELVRELESQQAPIGRRLTELLAGRP